MTYNELTKSQRTYVDAIRTEGPNCGIDTTKTEYSRAELRQVSLKTKGKIWIPNWITHDKGRRVGRGMFNIPEVPVVECSTESSATAPATESVVVA